MEKRLGLGARTTGLGEAATPVGRLERLEGSFLTTTHRCIAIFLVFLNPAFSNIPRVPLHRNEHEIFCPV